MFLADRAVILVGRAVHVIVVGKFFYGGGGGGVVIKTGKPVIYHIARLVMGVQWMLVPLMLAL